MRDRNHSSSSHHRSNLVSRRDMLGSVGAVGALAIQNSTWRQEVEFSQDPEIPQDPEQALKALYNGNERFASEKSVSRHRDLDRVRLVAPKQTPFAAFLGCADSRVPIEIVFDQGFGDLFVTRIAGNVASSENIGSLEFGTLVLGCQIIFVLGHSACGAVTAAMKGDEVPGQISGLFQHIRPAVKAAKGDLDTAIIENVKNQAMTIAESSPVISKLVQRRELIVAGGIYDLTTGKVRPIDVRIS